MGAEGGGAEPALRVEGNELRAGTETGSAGREGAEIAVASTFLRGGGPVVGMPAAATPTSAGPDGAAGGRQSRFHTVADDGLDGIVNDQNDTRSNGRQSRFQ